MSNLMRSQVEVELDGSPYVLTFNMYAIAAIEEAHAGQSIDRLLFGGQVPTGVLISAVRAGLMKKHGVRSVKKVANMLDQTVSGNDEALANIIKLVSRGILGGRGASAEKLAKFDRMMEDEAPDEDAEDDEPTREPDERPTSSAAAPGES